MEIPDTSPAESVAQPTVEQPNDATRAERLYPNDKPDEPQPQLKEKPQEPQAKPQDKSGADEFNIQMPEGVQLDQELLNSAVPMLREAGVSNDQASKLVSIVPKIQERVLTQMNSEFDKVRAGWTKEAKADREIGGNQWNETLRLAAVALKAGGAEATTHEARQLFNESGLGNHPAMIRLLRNIGREFERMQGQSGPSPRVSGIEAARDRHQKLVYPNDPPNLPFSSAQRAPRSRTERAYPKDQPRS